MIRPRQSNTVNGLVEACVKALEPTLPGYPSLARKLAATTAMNTCGDILLGRDVDPATLPPRLNVLLAGDEVLATQIAKQMAHACGLVYCSIPAVAFSGAGYAGLDIGDLGAMVFRAARGDIEAAEGALVHVTATDRVCRRDLGGQDDVGGAAVQHAFRAILMGSNIMFGHSSDRAMIRSDRIKFVFSGEFAGLTERIQRRRLRRPDVEDALPLGERDLRHIWADDLVEECKMEPEFVGSFAVRMILPALDPRERVRALAPGAVNETVQFKRFMSMLTRQQMVLDDSFTEALSDRIEQQETGQSAVLAPLWDCLCEHLGAPDAGRIILDASCLAGQPAWVMPADDDSPPPEIERTVTMKSPQPSCSHREYPELNSMSAEQLLDRLGVLKVQKLSWNETSGSARRWWTAFEEENSGARLRLVVRLAEELAVRNASITEFFLAYVYSNTDNIQANLHYLDYTRLKKEAQTLKRQDAKESKPAEQRATTSDSMPSDRTPSHLPLRSAENHTPDAMGSVCPDPEPRDSQLQPPPSPESSRERRPGKPNGRRKSKRLGKLRRSNRGKRSADGA